MIGECFPSTPPEHLPGASVMCYDASDQETFEIPREVTERESVINSAIARVICPLCLCFLLLTGTVSWILISHLSLQPSLILATARHNVVVKHQSLLRLRVE